jgi:hypothetical protein
MPSVDQNHVLGDAAFCFAADACTSRLSSPRMHTFSPATADGCACTAGSSGVEVTEDAAADVSPADPALPPRFELLAAAEAAPRCASWKDTV